MPCTFDRIAFTFQYRNR